MLFADTSYFIALADPDDHFHPAAIALSRSNRQPLLTSSAIVLELGAYFSQGPGRALFQRIMALLETDRTEIVVLDERGLRSGIELFRTRPDKEWSLTDCISFLIMQERGIIEALTSDAHFEQAGFVALLRAPGSAH